jgi:hypothetical protein
MPGGFENPPFIILIGRTRIRAPITIKRKYLEKITMLKTPKAIKRDILGKFRSLLYNHDTIPPNWLLKDYWQLLTTQEKGNFDQAVTDLIIKG